MPDPLRRLRRADPWGPALVAASVVVFLVHGFGGLLTRDLALYAYGGQQFAEGVPPFVSVLNRAGPLAHMVPGAATWVARQLGADSGYADLMAMRVLMMLLSMAAVWVVYLLARDLFRSRTAGVAAAVSLIAFQGFVIYATGGPREKTTMMLLVALALWAVVHGRWLPAGCAVALATLTWQPAFFAGAAAAGLAILLLRGVRPRVRALVTFAAGGLLVTLGFLLYFAAVDAVQEFLDAFYFINAEYTHQTGLRTFLMTEPEEMVEGFGWSLGLVLVGLAATVVLAVRRVREIDRDDSRVVAVVAFGGATVVSLLWCLKVFNGWADAVFMLPLAAVGLGGAVQALTRGRDQRTVRSRVAAYVVVVLVAGTVTSWWTRDERLSSMRDVNEAVLEVVGPEATVMSIGSPQPLVFGRRENPYRHQMFIAGLSDYIEDTWPGGLDGMVDDIEADRPTVITMDHPSWYDFVAPVIDSHYEYLGDTYLMTWYVDRSVGEDEIERLQEIVDAPLPDDG